LASSTVQITPLRATKSAVWANAEPEHKTINAANKLTLGINFIDPTMISQTPWRNGNLKVFLFYERR
jgi:hypothetical protein